MSENPEGKKDKLLIPAGDKTIGIPFLSSIATVPRGMIRIAGNVVKGDYAKAATDTFQTFASMAIKPLGDIAANSDYFGRKIYEETATAVEKQKSVLKYLGKQALAHPWVKAVAERIEDGPPENAVDWFETASTAGELPFRFYDTEDVLNSPFWDSYNASKELSDRYRDLKRKDSDKAEAFYTQHQEAIDELPAMKSALDSYFDKGDANALVEYMGGDIPQYENSPDAPQTTGEKALLYSKSFIANPIQTYQATSNKEPIRKLRTRGSGVAGFFDSSTVTERQKGLSDLDRGNKETQVDHITPKWIGGRETDDNYQVLTNEEHKAKSIFESNLREKYEGGKITRKAALNQLEDFQTRLHPIAIQPKEAKIKSVEDGIEMYKSGGGKLVEQRAEWVASQLEGLEGKERADLIQKLWDEKVITSGGKGVAAALKELGINVGTSGKGSKGKKLKGITFKATKRTAPTIPFKRRTATQLPTIKFAASPKKSQTIARRYTIT